MRKKILVLFVLIAAMSSFGLASLNVLPHTHGDDQDHSKHTSCAVYQASLIGLDSVQASSAVLFVVFFVLLLLTACQKPVFSNLYTYSASRAPPVLV